MIYPTLFIGLGSTGLRILEKFQQLALEHYGVPSLDIFQYMAIETRNRAEEPRLEGGENKIKLLRPVISSTDHITKALNDGHKQYLNEWLDRKILDIPGNAFEDGASNIRMAGKLILWENWANISRELGAANDAILAENNKKSTIDFLNQFYARRGQAIDPNKPPVEALPSVYIVGTLCGGSCSGMFIDIGYFTKHLTGLYARNLANPKLAKIIGIFTTFDSASVKNKGMQGIRGQAANTWAALKEYDFYCHARTEYQVEFPDGTAVATNERPIDWLYLLSCTATNANNTLGSNFRDDAVPDQESLNHMAAMTLFTETVGNLAQQKEAIRTDYRGRPRAMVTNERDHSPCIATCGMATIWYPKYRIAQGAASGYGVSLCGEWLKGIDQNTQEEISKKVRPLWRRMLLEHQKGLIASGDGTLLGDLEQQLSTKREHLLALSSSDFILALQQLVKRLNKGEQYDRQINNPEKTRAFKEVLVDKLKVFVRDSLDSKRNLSYAQFSLERLDGEIASAIEKLPTQYPSPDFDKIKAVSVDRFCRLVLKEKDVTRQNKEDLLQELTIDLLNGILKIRDFRLRPILEELREEIGAVKQLAGVQTEAGRVSIHVYLSIARKSLEDSQEKLKEQRTSLSKALSATKDVVFVFDGKSNVIKDDIDRLIAQLDTILPVDKEAIIENITGGNPFNHFLGFGVKEGNPQKILESIKEVLVMEALKRVGDFNVVKHVRETWSPADLAEFSKHALPHLELSPGHSGLASVVVGDLQHPVSFIAGGDGPLLGQMLDRQLNGTDVEGLFGRNHKSPTVVAELGHMLLFYREEPLMYMDENITASSLFQAAYDVEKNISDGYGVHTHKGREAVFDPRVYARRDKIETELIPIATKILSSRNSAGAWEKSDIFEIDGSGRLYFRRERKTTVPYRFTIDQNGIDNCAQDREIFEGFSNTVEEMLKLMEEEVFYQKLNTYLKWIELREEAKGNDPGPIMLAEQRSLMELSLIKKYFPEKSAKKEEV